MRSKHRHPLLFLFLSILSAPSLSNIIDTFSVDKEPGKGTLEFEVGDKKEAISFGAATGYYALGMYFSAKTLPAPYNKELAGHQILQLVLGSLPNRNPAQVPQFGSLMFVASKRIQAPTSFKLETSKKSHAKLVNTALVMLTSPLSPFEQSDEERLKGTFFAKSGGFSVKRVGKEKTVQILMDGKYHPFLAQSMEVSAQATLETPFNPVEAKLTGQLRFMAYSAKNAKAEELAQGLIAEGLGRSPARTSPPPSPSVDSSKPPENK